MIAAVKARDASYDLDSLVVEVRSWNPEFTSFEFKLLDEWTENRTDPWSDDDRLVIWHEENGNPIFYNPYIVYFPEAGYMVSRYMELIQSEDAAGLASFLNPDGIVVPIWVAEETISNYNQFLKGGSPTIRYLNRFNFVVENTRSCKASSDGPSPNVAACKPSNFTPKETL